MCVGLFCFVSVVLLSATLGVGNVETGQLWGSCGAGSGESPVEALGRHFADIYDTFDLRENPPGFPPTPVGGIAMSNGSADLGGMIADAAANA